MASSVGIIHKDADSDYGVSFPDFPGCVTAGKTLDEAGRMAAEALAGHIALGREYGDAIPQPMSLERAMAHEFAAGAVAFIVVPVVTPRRTAHQPHPARVRTAAHRRRRGREPHEPFQLPRPPGAGIGAARQDFSARGACWRPFPQS